jgi:CBS-domain-containing membrane protein
MKPMRVGDVMTRTVVSVRENTPFKDLVRIMHEHRVSGVPVLDAQDLLTGIVTEADLLRAEGDTTRPRLRRAFLEWFIDPARLSAIEKRADGGLAADVMTRDVITVTPQTQVPDAIRTLLRAEVKRLPVVDAQRRILGIVSRRDLLSPFLRTDEEIRREVYEEVIRGTMWIDPTTISVEVHHGVVTLRGRVERRSEKQIMAALVRRVAGVVGLRDELTYAIDDREIRLPETRSELNWGENWVRASSSDRG